MYARGARLCDHGAVTGPLNPRQACRDGVRIRVLTNSRVFDPPMPLVDALAFVDALRAQPRAVSLRPGERHWELFTTLCRDGNVRGNLVADAYHAALAIETGAEWITTDRDFARFRALRWRHPLE